MNLQAMVNKTDDYFDFVFKILFQIYFLGQFENFLVDQSKMDDALVYFCDLTEEKKREFISCPQVSGEAENYFSLAKAVGCNEEGGFANYLSGCNFVCQGIKAQFFENVKSSKQISLDYYTAEEKKFYETEKIYTDSAAAFTQLSDTWAANKEANYKKDPKKLQDDLIKQIDDATLFPGDDGYSFSLALVLLLSSCHEKVIKWQLFFVHKNVII